MSLYLKRNNIRGLRPSFFIIELNITELCDMKCEFCPRSEGYPNSNLNMSLDTLDNIVSSMEQLPQEVLVHISGRGEPTLHPQFDQVLKKLSKFKVKLSTNGNRVDRYLDQINQLHQVDYSIYDESKLTPQQAVKKYGFHVVDKRTSSNGIYNNRAGSVVKSITDNNPYHPKLGLFCEKPFTVVYINYNGDYNLCCNEWFNPTVLGNVNQESIYQFVTNNAKLKLFQQDLANGKRNLSPCNKCNKPAHPKAVDFLLNTL